MNSPNAPSFSKVNTGETLCELVDIAVEKFGPQMAFKCSGEVLTYAETGKAAHNIAAALLSQLKLGYGDRVGLMAPNVLEFPTATMGGLLAGMAMVNVNPLYTPSELKHQLNDSGTKALFIHGIAVPTLMQILSETQVETVIILPFQTGDKTFKAPPLEVPGVTFLSFPEFEASGAELNVSLPAIGPEDIAFLQYTGGTTGLSKGATLTHANLIANVRQFHNHAFDIIEEGRETVLTPIPLYHIFALTANCLAMFIHGARNILITNPRDLPSLIADWRDNDVTMATGVNTLFNGLLHHPDFPSIDFSPLKFVIGGGAPVQAAVSERWKAVTGNHLKEGYGLSETSPAVTMTPINEEGFHSSIGVPLSDTEISLRDDDGKEVADGEEGELCVRGPQVMRGYWNNEEATANCFTEDGFFKTGDIALVGEDGRLRIVDRKKDMILVSGFNVYPNEIESEVARHEGVLEAACVGQPDDRTGEAVILYVVRNDPDLTAEAIIEHCETNLARYKIPSQIHFIKEIPKSNVGKILRRELRGFIPNKED